MEKRLRSDRAEAEPSGRSRIDPLIFAPTTATPSVRPLPYRVDMSPVPDLVARSIADLAGIQPVTKAMFDAAGGELHPPPRRALTKNCGGDHSRANH